MNDLPHRTEFRDEVGRREEHQLRARRRPGENVLTSLAFFGLVGWSIVIPTLLGAALGRWLDRTWPGDRNWTLTLLVAGLVLGCLNASRWIFREQRAIDRDHAPEEGDERKP